ncbi:unnamed protein product [Echinostoma caproni]|uniref:Neur_chan_LBD domain-containing protein n=1 Tax=Echinostoma caproni TaxID=27848 RepID=A0A183A0G9_9TREM|nr:unnamed protein product [Echinostoma caproni]
MVQNVEVEVRVVFLKIGEIDTLKELYYADAFIQAKWREPKLDERTTEELTITELEQFWNPLLYIDNILSETKETQWMMAQRNDAGEVYLLERRRIKGLFLETLELNDFPLDVQSDCIPPMTYVHAGYLSCELCTPRHTPRNTYLIGFGTPLDYHYYYYY